MQANVERSDSASYNCRVEPDERMHAFSPMRAVVLSSGYSSRDRFIGQTARPFVRLPPHESSQPGASSMYHIDDIEHYFSTTEEARTIASTSPAG
jgi:hypothetical protein